VILSQGPLSVAALKSTILGAVDPTSSLTGTTITGGRLNVCMAITGCVTRPNFSMTVSPSSQTIARGASATYTVNIARRGGFADAVNLSVSGVPPNSTATFSPNPATGNGSTLTITTGKNTTRGSYSLTITGSGGGLTRAAKATLAIARK
jgi:hypothetical protein